jgi:hypothetical protein
MDVGQAQKENSLAKRGSIFLDENRDDEDRTAGQAVARPVGT